MDSSRKTCPICLTEEKTLMVFQCSHYICYQCLPGFIFIDDFPKKCPMCREDVFLLLITDSSELDIGSVLITTYGPLPKIAQYNPKPDHLQVVLWLPNFSSRVGYSAVLRRKTTDNKVLYEVLKSLRSCPLCRTETRDMNYLLTHIEASHNCYFCRWCPIPPVISPAFYSVYNSTSYQNHLSTYHSLQNIYHPQQVTFYYQMLKNVQEQNSGNRHLLINM